MNRITTAAILVLLLLILPSFTFAQTLPDIVDTNYKIARGIVERRIAVIDYSHRDGSTNLDFLPTPLLPNAAGKAKIKASNGYTQIEARFDHLESPTRYGSEYLTYVLWAIGPESRPVKLGEILLNAGRGSLTVMSSLYAFGLIVTAEPYSEVTQPNDIVVLTHFISSEMRTPFKEIETRYQLLSQGQYAKNALPQDLESNPFGDEIPLGMREAWNAIRIARWSGADQDATDEYLDAQELFRQAELSRIQDQSKLMALLARQAAKAAEDSRLLSLKRQEEKRIAAETAAVATKVAKEREAAERAKVEEERSNLIRAQQALILAAAEAKKANSDGRTVRPTAPDEVKNEAQERWSTDQREHQKLALRRQLIAQFNSFLQTRDSSTGLIINMPSAVFDIDKSTLKPEAREKLARVSGIILAHPGLRLTIEGYTDNTGTHEYNQMLSEKRAAAVRDFLMQQGIDGSLVSACGFGDDNPVASNATAFGRQLNRRVVIIVSGDIIGTPTL